jgi:probable HAF family extracellular repeat protein
MIARPSIAPLVLLAAATLGCRDVLNPDTDMGSVALSSVTAEGTTGYTAFEIGCPADLISCNSVDINDLGQVTGYGSDADYGTHGYFYDRGTFIDLGTFGVRWVWPRSINNRGQIVGWAKTDTDVPNLPYPNPVKQQHAFLWQDGALTDLQPYLEPVSQWWWRFGHAYDINDAGLIGGRVLSYQGWARAFALDGEVVTDLGWVGGPYGPPYSDMQSVNDAGDMVGVCHVRSDGVTKVHPCLWRDNVLSDIGLPGDTFYMYDYTVRINNDGVVVGSYWDLGVRESKVYSWQDGIWSDLGIDNVRVVDMNDRFQVAVNRRYAAAARAAVWQDFELSVLPVPDGYDYVEASAINNLGIVAGSGRRSGSYWNRALVWMPNRLEALIEVVQSLEVNRGIEVALTATLQAALASVQNDRPAAISQLRAFQAQVEGLRGQKLTNTEVDLFLTWVEGIIDELASG